MSDKSPVREELIKVHSYDLDSEMRLKPSRIMEWFGELAWVHANELGFGYEQLKARNQLWVLGSVSLRILEQPTWRHDVKLYTHLGDRQSFFYHRDLAIKDPTTQKVYIDCRTRWIVLNATTRRPVREVEIPDDTPEGLPPLFEQAFPKVRFPKELEPTFSVDLLSQRDDLDQNRHVNNGRYMTWAMESYSPEFIDSHSLVHIDAHFKNECFAGTPIRSEAFEMNEEEGYKIFLHRILNKDDQSDLCHLRFIWQDHA